VTGATTSPAVSSPRLRLFALVLSTLCSTPAPLFAKYAETSFSPLTMTLLRVWIATLVLIPIALRMVPAGLHWRRFVRSLPVSLGYCGNIVFFGIGIASTTAMTSQLLYLLVPVLALIGSRIFFAEALTAWKLLGTALGISGAVLVIIGSLRGNVADSLGTPFGNGMLLLAVFSWSGFLLFSRAKSQSFHPLELTCYALLTASLIVPFLTLPDLLQHHALQGPLTWLGIFGALSMALFVSVARDITFQWGIKGSSAFFASALGFAGPFLTVAYAIPLLGEQLTTSLIISGILTTLGIIFAVILPSWQAHRKERFPTPAGEDTGATPLPTPAGGAGGFVARAASPRVSASMLADDASDTPIVEEERVV
jgi:drug/metabolite transporter (DMT)-like permease